MNRHGLSPDESNAALTQDECDAINTYFTDMCQDQLVPANVGSIELERLVSRCQDFVTKCGHAPSHAAVHAYVVDKVLPGIQSKRPMVPPDGESTYIDVEQGAEDADESVAPTDIENALEIEFVEATLTFLRNLYYQAEDGYVCLPVELGPICLFTVMVAYQAEVHEMLHDMVVEHFCTATDGDFPVATDSEIKYETLDGSIRITAFEFESATKPSVEFLEHVSTQTRTFEAHLKQLKSTSTA